MENYIRNRVMELHNLAIENASIWIWVCVLFFQKQFVVSIFIWVEIRWFLISRL